MAGLVQKIVLTSRGRLAQLIPGVGQNQQCRASDYNTLVDAVNDIIQATDSSPVPVAYNATATLAPLDMASGWITSTSGAAVSLTTCTAAQLITALGINPVTGSSFDFVIDNSAGANTITLVLDSTIAAITPVITGQDTLTVSTANVYGWFKIIFNSATTAKIIRVF